MTIVCLGIGTGVFLSRKPWQELREQRALVKDADIEMKKAENDRAELVSQEARMSNPAGRERAARQRGYHKPGEIPIEDLK